jgi:hypothetical protein
MCLRKTVPLLTLNLVLGTELHGYVTPVKLPQPCPFADTYVKVRYIDA